MFSSQFKHKQIIISKRANIFYIEKARVMQKENRVVWLTETNEDIEHYFNLPHRNTSLVLLGTGTSITNAAVRHLAQNNVMIGFCGSGGSPLFCATDYVFLPTTNEYRPTEYMRKWLTIWDDEQIRLTAAKDLQRRRTELVIKNWPVFFKNMNFNNDSDFVASFLKDIDMAQNSQELLAAEGRWVKKLYKSLAVKLGVKRFKREHKNPETTENKKINSMLTHGNYIAYGMASATLHTLGISFALPLLHGKTRRGGLVFDVADLIKDAYVVPLAFQYGTDTRAQSRDFRKNLINELHKKKTLDLMFDVVIDIAQRYNKGIK